MNYLTSVNRNYPYLFFTTWANLLYLAVKRAETVRKKVVMLRMISEQQKEQLSLSPARLFLTVWIWWWHKSTSPHVFSFFSVGINVYSKYYLNIITLLNKKKNFFKCAVTFKIYRIALHLYSRPFNVVTMATVLCGIVHVQPWHKSPESQSITNCMWMYYPS